MAKAGKTAVITGASSGIGLELARIAAKEGFDLFLAADEPLSEVSEVLRGTGAAVTSFEGDLADTATIDDFYDKIVQSGRRVDVLMANAGHGLGHGFLDQQVADWRHVIDTNITGTLYLIWKIARDMRASRDGKILITGSIAGFMPGTYQAVYNGTKAFIDSFAFALGHELQDDNVKVTCLMPGPTDTNFFARANMLDTKVGEGKKDDPADVARTGFDAMMSGKSDVVAGWKNKLETTIANVTPSDMLAEQHRKMAEPKSAKH